MSKDKDILNLFRKIICSLLCISKNTTNNTLKEEATDFLNYYLSQYVLYNDNSSYKIENVERIINFCNNCYEDKNVFDYAEDVEYGVIELYEITLNKKGS